LLVHADAGEISLHEHLDRVMEQVRSHRDRMRVVTGPSRDVVPEPKLVVVEAGQRDNAVVPRRSIIPVHFHAIATPRVSSRPIASQSVAHRGPPPAVPHQAK